MFSEIALKINQVSFSWGGPKVDFNVKTKKDKKKKAEK